MPRGELQVSLCYEESQRRLRTRVISVKNIQMSENLYKISDIDFSGRACKNPNTNLLYQTKITNRIRYNIAWFLYFISDLSNLSTYVKVLLIANDEVQKRRRSSLQKCSPEESNAFYFNEEYIFPITASDAADQVTVTFTVTCRDVQGHSLTLGKANVGSLTYADGPGLLQWQHMLESPSQWVTKSLNIT